MHSFPQPPPDIDNLLGNTLLGSAPPDQPMTQLAPNLRLQIPIISSIWIRLPNPRWRFRWPLTGAGLIHYNMSDERQIKEVARVKTTSMASSKIRSRSHPIKISAVLFNGG